MKTANLYWLVALAFAASEAGAQTVQVCNAATRQCVSRAETQAETDARIAAGQSAQTAEVAARPEYPITRRQLAQAFRACSSAGTPAAVLTCLRDSLTNLETQ